MSSQEQGQPSPGAISATETNLIAGSTDTVFNFISGALDKGRNAIKRICYESLIAKGSDTIYLPVARRYPKNIVEKAGFKVVDEEDGDTTQYMNVVGSKRNLIHEYIFTCRDGAQRAVNTQSATVLVEMMRALGQQPPEVTKAILSAMGKEKVFDIWNEVFRLSGAGLDVVMEMKPGESDELLVEDEQQVIQMIQQLGEAVKQNTQDIAQIKGFLIGGQPQQGQQQPQPTG